MIANDDLEPDQASSITIEFDLTSFKCFVLIIKAFALDLRGSNFGALIGFEQTVIRQLQYGMDITNITNSLDTLYVHCDLVDNSVVDREYGNVIYTISTADLRLLGCGAVLVLVPAVPIFVAIAGALPAGISVVVSKAQLKEKENLYKGCHRVFKQLLREVQMNKLQPDVDEREIIREIFSKILELEKGANYVVPFERYMKKYKLNGYYSKK